MALCVRFLQALAPDQKAAALEQHEPTLEALALAIAHRAELKPVALPTATADARDLPEELRLVSSCTHLLIGRASALHVRWHACMACLLCWQRLCMARNNPTVGKLTAASWQHSRQARLFAVAVVVITHVWFWCFADAP